MVFLPNSHSVPFAVCCEGCQGIALFGIGTIYIYIHIYIYLPDIKKSKFAKIPADCQANDFNFWKTLLWSTAHHGLKEVCFTCEDTQQDQDNVMGQISLYSLLTDIHLEPFFQKNRFPHLKPSKTPH